MLENVFISFREYSDGFVDFNKWKNNDIDESIHSIYSKSDNMKRKHIVNDLMKELTCKVIHLINKNYSMFMTEQKVRNSVQMKFKNDVSYNMIKHLNAGFWKNVHESWCSHM